MQFLVRRTKGRTDRERVTTTGRTGTDGQRTDDDVCPDGKRTATVTTGHDDTRRDARTKD